MARYVSGNNEPLTRWNNLPIYLTTIVTAAFVLGLVFTAVTSAARFPGALLLAFPMPLEPSWSIWRLVTHVFIAQLSFFTPFAIFMFYWWSLGIETHLGRAVLSKLLLGLALVGPAVGAVWWWGFDTPSLTMGNYAFSCGLLVAFATLYPTTEAFGWVPFKWIAFACIACGSLMLLAEHEWVQLSQLLAACVVGFLSMRQAQEAEYDDHVPVMAKVRQWFRKKPKLRVLPRPEIPRVSAASPESADVDELLDKIAKSGIDSLTPKERSRLEKAREALLKKDRT